MAGGQPLTKSGRPALPLAEAVGHKREQARLVEQSSSGDIGRRSDRRCSPTAAGLIRSRPWVDRKTLRSLFFVYLSLRNSQAHYSRCCQRRFQNACSGAETCQYFVAECDDPHIRFVFQNWRGRDGNDPSVDIAKDADQRF